MNHKGISWMDAALVHSSALYATTIATGLFMLRLGSVKGQVESKTALAGARCVTGGSQAVVADALASGEDANGKSLLRRTR
jgi:hypothetical protein